MRGRHFMTGSSLLHLFKGMLKADNQKNLNQWSLSHWLPSFVYTDRQKQLAGPISKVNVYTLTILCYN